MIELYNEDCLLTLERMSDKSVDVVLTDIPYGVINRESNGLRSLDKGVADVMNINISTLLRELTRVCTGQIIIFCAKEQLSQINGYFIEQKGTTRVLVWEKTNPSPMNGQHIYLSGIELAVWFKPRGRKVFNAHCKNTVFRHPSGTNKIHPTQKNLNLFKELILDNSLEGEIILDPFMGSGTTGVACLELKRSFIGVERDTEFFKAASDRIYKDSICTPILI